MYESTQQLVGCIVVCSLIAAVGCGFAALFAGPRMETPHDDGKGTRIGNHKDRSRAAIKARSCLASGRFADGSCDYVSTPHTGNPKS